MYGINPIASSRVASEGFMVHSLWYTLQGEGPFAGKPAIFLRLAGCNLRCTWCDTEFDKGAHQQTATELLTDLAAMVLKEHCNFIVITGGEPLLQPLHLIIDAPALLALGCKFQIETAGTYWPLGGLTEIPELARDRLSIVCSPKTPVLTINLRSALNYDVYWKYIIRASEGVSDYDGLPYMSTQIPGRTSPLFRPSMLHQLKDRIFVQACDEGDDVAGNIKNLHMATELALQYGYRLSIQQHKILGLA